MVAILKIIIKSLWQAAKKTAKNDAIKSGGIVSKGIYNEATTGFTRKALTKMAKTELIRMGYKSGLGAALNAYFNYSKSQKIGWKDTLIEYGLGKNSLLLKKAHVRYRGQISKQMSLQRNKDLETLKKLGERNMRQLKRMEYDGIGIEEGEANYFKEYFKSLNSKEKKAMQNLLKNDMFIVWNSSWIAFGLFIPYGSNKQRGVMSLQLYGSKSKKNPSLFYSWVRVSKKDWEIITEHPNGKSFWKHWYHENRKNQYHLTAQSKYKIKNKKQGEK